METKILKERLGEIEMPKEMQERIVRKCYIEMKEKTVSKKNTKNFFKRPMIAVASLALCLCLTGITTLAATGKLQGFFKDIKGWNGAVIGNSYEQATDEVKVSVVEVTDTLTVAVTMLNPSKAPYSSFETVGVERYQIIDMDGNVVVEGTVTELGEVVDGKANVNISLDEIMSGKYKLVVSELVGSAKAEQPLVISGTWECEFTH